MKTNKLLRKLAVNFPKSIKSPGDYVGLMTGKLKDETNTILLCLDLDNEVYETMIEKGYKPDLILTHHPFIYGTKYAIIETAAICLEMFIPITKMLPKKKNNTKYLISIFMAITENGCFLLQNFIKRND